MRVLDSLAALDEAVRHSHDRPIVIFKHSVTCGTSAWAFEEIEDLNASAAEVFVVPVQMASLVSGEIARRFGLRHESPQALVVHEGVVIWHASHFRVTREEIAAALGRITSRQG